MRIHSFEAYGLGLMRIHSFEALDSNDYDLLYDSDDSRYEYGSDQAYSDQADSFIYDNYQHDESGFDLFD